MKRTHSTVRRGIRVGSGTKFVSCLLTAVLVIGLMPSYSVFAFADGKGSIDIQTNDVPAVVEENAPEPESAVSGDANLDKPVEEEAVSEDASVSGEASDEQEAVSSASSKDDDSTASASLSDFVDKGEREADELSGGEKSGSPSLSFSFTADPVKTEGGVAYYEAPIRLKITARILGNLDKRATQIIAAEKGSFKVKKKWSSKKEEAGTGLNVWQCELELKPAEVNSLLVRVFESGENDPSIERVYGKRDLFKADRVKDTVKDVVKDIDLDKVKEVGDSFVVEAADEDSQLTGTEVLQDDEEGIDAMPLLQHQVTTGVFNRLKSFVALASAPAPGETDNSTVQEISIEFPPAENDFDGILYYKDDFSATVTLLDSSYGDAVEADADYSGTVTLTLLATNEALPVSLTQDSTDFTKWTGSVPITAENEASYISVSATGSGDESTVAVKSEKQFLIDKADPTIKITAAPVSDATGSANANGTKVLFAKESEPKAIVTIIVEDSNLDMETKPTVEVAPDGGSAESKTVSWDDSTAGTLVGTFELSGANTYDVSVAGAKDKANRTKDESKSIELEQDDIPPTLDVDFDEPESKTIDGTVYYATKRTATVTVTDANFDPSSITVRAGGQDGDAVRWSSGADDAHTAIVEFDGNSSYQLKVSGGDAARNALVAKDSDTTVTNGVYESDTFWVWGNPELTVTADPASSDDEGRFYDISKRDLTFTVFVKDPFFDESKISITTDPADKGNIEKDGTDVKWEDGAGDLEPHTTKVVYGSADESSGNTLTVESTDASRPLTGGSVDAASKKYELSNFTVDANPPTITPHFPDAKKVVTAVSADGENKGTPEIRYYDDEVNASLGIADGVGLGDIQENLMVTINGDRVSAAEASSTGMEATYELSFPKEEGNAKTYTLEVSGKDGAGVEIEPYKVIVIVDDAAPTIEVSYGDAEGEGTRIEGNDSVPFKFYTNEDSVVATITVVDDGIDAESDDLKVSLDGVEQPDIAWSKKPGSSNEYEAEIEVAATSTLAVAAKDYAGNESSHNESIIISQEQPELKVSYSPTPTRDEAKIHAYNSKQVDDDGVVTVTVEIDGKYLVDQDLNGDPVLNLVSETSKTADSDGAEAESSNITPEQSGYDSTTGKYLFKYEIDPPEDENSYVVEVRGTDLCGNVLVAAEGDESMMGAMEGGVYRSRLIIDKKRPTVEVNIGESTLEQGEEFVSGSDVTVTVAVDDKNVDADLMTVWFGGEEVRLSNDGKASYTFKVADGDDRTFEVSVSGTDAALNELDVAAGDDPDETRYLAYVTVDRKKPKLVADFDDPASSGYLDTGDAVCYYSQDSATAKLTMTERHFDTADVSVTNDKGVVGEWHASDWNPVDESDDRTLEVQFGGPGVADDVYALTVTGKDSADNELNEYAAKVVIDSKSPELTVKWNDKPLNGKYLNSERTAEITVKDPFIDISTVKVNGSAGQEWTKNGDTYTMTVSYSDEGSNLHLTVEGNDKAGNPLSGGDDLGKQTNDEGEYDSGAFVIDKTAPKVALKTSQSLSRNIGGVDYFNASDTMQVTVSVSDQGGFDPRSDAVNTTQIALSGKPAAAYSVDDWESAGLYTVTFNENDASARTSALTVTAYDLAGNCTVYSYGGAEAKVVESGKEPETVSGSEYGATFDELLGSVLTGKAFTVDATAADVAAQDEKGSIPTSTYSGSYDADDGTYIFFKDDTSFKVVLTDAIGLHRVQLMNDKGGAEKSYLKDDSPKDVSSYDLEVNLKDAQAFKDGTEYSGDYVLRVEDTANNVRYWRINVAKGTIEPAGNGSDANTPLYLDKADLYPAKAIQDTVRPALKFSGVSAGAYYNSPQTARLDVTELNFGYLKSYDGSQGVITIKKEEGRAGRAVSYPAPITVASFNAMNADEGKYYRTLSFDSDGHYSLEATLTDPAGNISNKATMGEFTIDRTKPTISVSFDNNSAVNGKYYPAGRTATIVVTEHNFNPADFNIDTTGSIGSWSDNGDEHTIRVAFATDGTYTMTVTGKDMAGNALDTYTEEEFVIDLTNPQIDFSVIDDGNAYNGVVTPTITFSDEANFDSSGVEYTLTGTKNGGVEYGAGSSDGDNSRTITYNDFGNVGMDEYDPNYDDIYTLEAHMTDMAGNSAEGTITFSVNRFGSNFRVLSDLPETEGESFITNERPEIKIQEINVSGVETEAHGVTVTNGTTVTNLRLNEQRQDTGYIITSDTSDDDSSRGWASYTYTVAPGNFDRDGRYFVAVNSDDRATNKNTSSNYFNRSESKLSAAEVSFILDTTDPEVVGLHVDGGDFDETLKGEFSVVDDIGVREVKVVLGNDEELVVEQNDFGGYSFDMPGRSIDLSRDITVVATDLAGNNGSGNTSVGSMLLFIVIGLVVLVVAAIGGAVYFVRRNGIDLLDVVSAKE